MVGIGETYISAFSLAYGFSERFAGLATVLPLGVASILQLVSGRFLVFFKSRRMFVVTCAILQAICLILITLRGTSHTGKPEGLMLILAFYWLFGLSAGPVWNAWVVSLVPADRRMRFFSERGKVHELALLCGLMAGGMSLYWNQGTLQTFTTLFFIAGILRLISAFALYKHPDEEDPVRYKPSFDLINFFKWIKSQKVIGILLFLGLFQFGVAMGSPYFSPFILKKLEMPYSLYMIVLAVPLISRAISYSFHERAVKRWGIKVVLFCCSMTIALMPLFWARFPSMYVIVLLQFLTGWSWAGFEYCILLRQIDDFGAEERSRVLTWSNLVVGVCNIMGVLVGSAWLGSTPVYENYLNLFTLSSTFRFLPLAIIFMIHWEAYTKVRKIFVRALAIRPNKGALTRPILYIEDEDEEVQNKKSDL
jgi:predicted MFS family arabinose efflux permease